MAATLREHMDNDKVQKETDEATKSRKKGTLAGVFIPTCEGMWGVLIFLKFSYVVGIGGVGHALLAVFVSFIAALCTTICVSAIASSGGVVSEGGPYYMISRSLGPYIGVSVGITYWFGITFLGVMEAVGAVDALSLMCGDTLTFTWAPQALGSAFMLTLSVFVYGGINLVTKLGVVFGIVVFLTLVAYYVSLALAPLAALNPDSYVTGLSAETLSANWYPMYPSGTDFGTLMSLFFPCFTGILAGADRADVLRDPPKNIKYGTMAAITFSLVMYATFMVMWGAVADGCWLRGDCPSTSATALSAGQRRLSGDDTPGVEAMTQELLWPNKTVVLIGVLISCCSQTLQCLIVAPRLLRAIAADHLIPFLRPLAQLSKRNEPARALLATYILSAGLVLIGSVNILAPMVTISFLVCYGFLNIACIILTVLRTPTWRPTGIFQLRWRLFYIGSSVIGFAACLAIALIVSRLWTMAIVFFALLLYWYVARSGEEAEWGSGMDGLRYGLALGALLGLKREQHRRINWRPQLLAVFSLGDVNQASEIETGNRLIQLCGQLRKGRGMTVVAGILEGCPEEPTSLVTDRVSQERLRIEQLMTKNNMSGFSEVVAAGSWKEGARFVTQLSGLGGLRPNTVVVPWPEAWRHDAQRGTDYVRMISQALTQEKAVVCPRNLTQLPLSDSCPDQCGFIDLWWFITDGGLLVLLTWLLAQHRMWRNCSVRVFVVVENVTPAMAEMAADTVRRMFQQKRILCNVSVETVILSDEMLEPFTYDWTLRVDRRGTQDVNASPHLPHSLDELFLEAGIPAQEANSSVAVANSEGRLRRILKKAMHPRKVLRDIRRGGKKTAAPQVKTLNEAFNRKGAITEANERDLLDTLNQRCRLRRQEMENELEDPDADNESTLGDLVSPSQPAPTNTSSLYERLNQVILSRSKDSSLVMLNMPDIWGTSPDDCASFLAFCECLVKGLDRVIFVHSSGNEVVQIF